MKTLFDPAAREAMLARLDRLTPDARPRWGKMNAGRMVCHLIDSVRAALGEMECRQRKSFMSNPVVRWLIIDVIPWPKGKAQTAPEFLSTQPAELEADRAELRRLVESFARRGPAGPWAPHPSFGALSGAQYGRLVHRHFDHHFRQFGV